eukprot:NODE_2611_length_500_cov_297.751663_g2074_i0.p1 GENE.NODE_2611_length_500_cov_297.751663_g2074_i0~~NODE_2611_length_500_cov_297.751663_g2074_i0.p1  ORF type:complete len:121 (-),score=36.91 NODE_2611_length_500_cov_297.751663_g2074_i0:136-447(-)
MSSSSDDDWGGGVIAGTIIGPVCCCLLMLLCLLGIIITAKQKNDRKKKTKQTGNETYMRYYEPAIMAPTPTNYAPSYLVPTQQPPLQFQLPSPAPMVPMTYYQ